MNIIDTRFRVQSVRRKNFINRECSFSKGMFGDMTFYVVFSLLVCYGLYVVFEVVFQYYLEEFGMDKTQPLSMGKIVQYIFTYLMRNI